MSNLKSKDYDYLIVGAGLYGAIFASKLKHFGKRVLVIEKRDHFGGNIYCENIEGINVHKYGPHIFHTSDKEIWDYVNSFVAFNNFIYSPLANNNGKLYNLPLNMNTFYQLWGVKTPDQAKNFIKTQSSKFKSNKINNLEEYALSILGSDLYYTFIKGYTEKQWGREAKDLPVFIIKRIPIRYIFDNNYFDDIYQGIPIGGYNALINNLLDGIEVRLNTDFHDDREYFERIADKILYTGSIDVFYNYEYGKLEFRSLDFRHEILELENYQGNVAINYTEKNIPYTRIIEHKHFEFGKQSHTVITREYPAEYKNNNEPYYPINNDRNTKVFEAYKKKACSEPKYLFGGRLGDYKYYDMDDTIKAALKAVEKEQSFSI